jgi:hypothetical protein
MSEPAKKENIMYRKNQFDIRKLSRPYKDTPLPQGTVKYE